MFLASSQMMLILAFENHCPKGYYLLPLSPFPPFIFPPTHLFPPLSLQNQSSLLPLFNSFALPSFIPLLHPSIPFKMIFEHPAGTCLEGLVYSVYSDNNIYWAATKIHPFIHSSTHSTNICWNSTICQTLCKKSKTDKDSALKEFSIWPGKADSIQTYK